MANGELFINRPIPKKYMFIGELADKLNVATSVLRFYEQEHSKYIGNLRKPKGLAGNMNVRKYNIKQQQRIQIIHGLKEFGLTHVGINKVVTQEGKQELQQLIDKI